MVEGYVYGENYSKVDDDACSVSSLEDTKDIAYLSDEELSNKYTFLDKNKTKKKTKNNKKLQLTKDKFV